MTLQTSLQLINVAVVIMFLYLMWLTYRGIVYKEVSWLGDLFISFRGKTAIFAGYIYLFMGCLLAWALLRANQWDLLQIIKSFAIIGNLDSLGSEADFSK